MPSSSTGSGTACMDGAIGGATGSMMIFGKLPKLPLCYKRYVLYHPGLHLPSGWPTARPRSGRRAPPAPPVGGVQRTPFSSARALGMSEEGSAEPQL